MTPADTPVASDRPSGNSPEPPHPVPAIPTRLVWPHDYEVSGRGLRVA